MKHARSPVVLVSAALYWATLACFLGDEQPADARRQRTKTTVESILDGFLQDRDVKRAEQALKKCVAEDPTFAPAFYDLGRLQETEEAWDDALRSFKECTKLEPGSKLGQNAEEHCRRIEEIQERSRTPEGARNLSYDKIIAAARDMIEARRFGEAIAACKQATEVDDSRYEAHSLASAAHARLLQYDSAVTELDAAISRAPAEKKETLANARTEMQKEADSENHRAKAMAAMADGSYSVAAGEFEAAWRARPSFEGYGLRAASAYQLANSTSDALRILKKLSASKDLMVAQVASNQLVRINSMTKSLTAANENVPSSGTYSSNSSTGNDLRSQIAAADAQLNAVYKRLRSTLSSSARDALKQEEIDWIAKKERLDEGSEELLSTIKDRTAVLEGRLGSTSSSTSGYSGDLSAEIARADDELNAVYRQLRSSLSASGKQALKEEELAWIKQKDRYPEGSEGRLRELQSRAAELRSRLRN
jgi:uncharacterized protein YecT (DUF1311 family)